MRFADLSTQYRIEALQEALAAGGVAHWYAPLAAALSDYVSGKANKDIQKHLDAMTPWLHVRATEQHLNQAIISLQAPRPPITDKGQLREALLALHPWRKGPYSFFGIALDAEWRADLKWDRIQPILDCYGIKDKTVLDIGAGNGYYMLRLLGAGSRFVLGVDQSVYCMAQFLLVACWLRPQAWLIPTRLEALPVDGSFDWVVSMGVLSHQRDPHLHLQQLYGKIAPHGRLLLETLVVPEGAERGEGVLTPTRYAGMRNIWQLPTVSMALRWLKSAGFKQVEWIRSDPTTTTEQRTTQWMRFESLADRIDPTDPTRTIEGHPAPVRAVFTASRGRP